MDDAVSQNAKVPNRFGRPGLYGGQRPVGAHFHTAIATDATIVVEADGFRIGRDGRCRAVTPAFAAHPAFAGGGHRPLD
jgi:hypothetical protein